MMSAELRQGLAAGAVLDPVRETLTTATETVMSLQAIRRSLSGHRATLERPPLMPLGRRRLGVTRPA